MACAPGQSYIIYRTLVPEGTRLKVRLSCVFLDFFAARSYARSIQDAIRRNHSNAILTESAFLYLVDADTCMQEITIHTLQSPEVSGVDEAHELGYIVATRSWRLLSGENLHPSSLEVRRYSEYGHACDAAAILAYKAVGRHTGTSTDLTVRHDSDGLPCWTEYNENQTKFVVRVLERGLDDDEDDADDELED